MEKAWQWWYQKKLTQLESEANLIRDRLLQESFAIRRSWELSLRESNQPNSSFPKQCVDRLEELSFALKELSDRLYPPYLNEGLPFALQYLIRRWQKQLPKCQFKLNLPQKWQQKSSANSFIVLNILENLLHLQEAKILSNNLIYIDLEQNMSIGRLNNQLKVMHVGENCNDSITNCDLVKGDGYGKRQEIQYLQQIFEGLTSGSCSNIVTENSDIWLFKW